MNPNRIEYRLAFWIAHKRNVLFRSRDRASFAATITTAFEVAGLRWRSILARDAKIEQLLTDTSVEAMLFSGLDRIPRNFVAAVMQLIRSKKINNRCFPNLKVVWAIVGRSEDELEEYAIDLTEPSCEPFDVVMTVPN